MFWPDILREVHETHGLWHTESIRWAKADCCFITGKKAELQEPLQKQTDFCSALSMSQNAVLWTDDMSAIMLNKAIWNVKTMFKNYIYDKSLHLNTE